MALTKEQVALMSPEEKAQLRAELQAKKDSILTANQAPIAAPIAAAPIIEEQPAIEDQEQTTLGQALAPRSTEFAEKPVSDELINAKKELENIDSRARSGSLSQKEAKADFLKMRKLKQTVSRLETAPSFFSKAFDVTSAPGRAFVALIDKAAGISGFMESMSRLTSDGESGAISEFTENIIRAPDTFIGFMTGGPTAKVAQKLASFASKSPKSAKALKVLYDAFQQGAISASSAELEEVAKGNEKDLLRFTESLGFNVLADVGMRAGVGMLKRAGKTIKSVLEQAPEKANIPAERLRPDPQGFQQTPAMFTDDPIRRAIEAKAQTTPSLQDIPQKITEQNFAAFQKSLSGIEGVKVEKIGKNEFRVVQDSRFELGRKLGEEIEETGEDIGLRFKSKELETIEPIRGQELPQIKVGEKQVSPDVIKTDIATGLKTTTLGDIIDITKNESSLDIKSQLSSIGFDGKKITGNEKAGGETIGFLRNLQNKINNAKNIDNLIEQRRKIQARLFKDKKSLEPVFDTRDQGILNQTYAKINERIAEQIKDPDMRKAWQEANRSYSNDRDLLEQISKKIGVEFRSTVSETYIQKLGKVGVENLQKLSDNKKMRPLFDEVKRGFYNDFIKSILKKDVAEISMDKFLSKWFKMDPDVKKLLIPKSVIGEIDKTHAKVMNILGVDVSMLRGSRTAPLQEMIKGGKISGVAKSLTKTMLSRPLLKAYFKTGEFPAETLVHHLGKWARNPKIQTLLTALDKAVTPKKIQFLTQRLTAEYARTLKADKSKDN